MLFSTSLFSTFLAALWCTITTGLMSKKILSPQRTKKMLRADKEGTGWKTAQQLLVYLSNTALASKEARVITTAELCFSLASTELWEVWSLGRKPACDCQNDVRDMPPAGRHKHWVELGSWEFHRMGRRQRTVTHEDRKCQEGHNTDSLYTGINIFS